MAVFGAPGKVGRNTDQRLVLAHLRRVGSCDLPLFQADKNGTFDPLAAAHRDGARTITLIIERQLEIAKKMNEEEKPKPKVKR